MTLGEFRERLREQPRAGWHVRPRGGLRDACGRCPLEAVDGTIGDFLASARRLEIDPVTAERIAKAADGIGDEEIRALLLSDVGLADG